MTCTKTLAWLTSAITKAAGIAWIILAGFAVNEILTDFADEAYSLKGSTLYIPLQVCKPTSLQVDGQNISFDNVVSHCETIKYFYNAIAVSLIVSMTCILAYLFFCLLAALDKCSSLDLESSMVWAYLSVSRS
jgi:hypothetical protein